MVMLHEQVCTCAIVILCLECRIGFIVYFDIFVLRLSCSNEKKQKGEVSPNDYPEAPRMPGKKSPPTKLKR